jgi:hypothetical protein
MIYQKRRTKARKKANKHGKEKGKRKEEKREITCTRTVAINLTKIYFMGKLAVLLFFTELYIFLMCFIV